LSVIDVPSILISSNLLYEISSKKEGLKMADKKKGKIKDTVKKKIKRKSKETKDK